VESSRCHFVNSTIRCPFTTGTSARHHSRGGSKRARAGTSSPNDLSGNPFRGDARRREHPPARTRIPGARPASQPFSTPFFCFRAHLPLDPQDTDSLDPKP
jgi:hypothetical protein